LELQIRKVNYDLCQKSFPITVPEKAHQNIWNSNSNGILAEFQIPIPIPVLGDWNKKPEGATKLGRKNQYNPNMFPEPGWNFPIT